MADSNVRDFESDALMQAIKQAKTDMRLYSTVRAETYTQALRGVQLVPVQSSQSTSTNRQRQNKSSHD